MLLIRVLIRGYKLLVSAGAGNIVAQGGGNIVASGGGNLVASGASVRTCQVLARHSTPSLTIGIHAKASLHAITGAVEALPDLTPTALDCEAGTLAATGTDGGSALTARRGHIAARPVARCRGGRSD